LIFAFILAGLFSFRIEIANLFSADIAAYENDEQNSKGITLMQKAAALPQIFRHSR